MVLFPETMTKTGKKNDDQGQAGRRAPAEPDLRADQQDLPPSADNVRIGRHGPLIYTMPNKAMAAQLRAKLHRAHGAHPVVIRIARPARSPAPRGAGQQAHRDVLRHRPAAAHHRAGPRDPGLRPRLSIPRPPLRAARHDARGARIAVALGPAKLPIGRMRKSAGGAARRLRTDLCKYGAQAYPGPAAEPPCSTGQGRPGNAWRAPSAGRRRMRRSAWSCVLSSAWC